MSACPACRKGFTEGFMEAAAHCEPAVSRLGVSGHPPGLRSNTAGLLWAQRWPAAALPLQLMPDDQPNGTNLPGSEVGPGYIPAGDWALGS